VVSSISDICLKSIGLTSGSEPGHPKTMLLANSNKEGFLSACNNNCRSFAWHDCRCHVEVQGSMPEYWLGRVDVSASSRWDQHA
jgi:hypothetical protein